MRELFSSNILSRVRFNKQLLIAIIPFAVFCVLLFKNISYPLLWNDETETIVHSRQILKHGYPKMHDEKNFLHLDNIDLGYKASSDANISMPWGHYYFAAIPTFFAQFVDDFYLKTGIIRSAFALIGLAGLLFFILSVRNYYKSSTSFSIAVAIFFVMCSSSVPLLLNMREARYYSVVIFVVGWFFFLFVSYFLFNQLSSKKYLVLMTLLLFFAYQVNVATFAVCCLSMGIFQAFFFVLGLFSNPKKNIKDAILIELRNFMPVIISGVLNIPFLIYFETFSTVQKATALSGFDNAMYIGNIERMYYVLKTQEFLSLALIIKYISLLIITLTLKQNAQRKTATDYILEKGSLFMTIFFVCFILMLAKMPRPMIYTRYFIVLQPIMTLIVLLDVLIIIRYIGKTFSKKAGVALRTALFVFMAITLTITGNAKAFYFKEYLYQISHPLQGPLDYLIPYIKEHYKEPDKLVIATNYEELSYIYYLNCRVILGAYANPEDAIERTMQPDIIIFRKSWGHSFAPYQEFLERAPYTRISFPVYDTKANDLTELDFIVAHLFRTPYTDAESQKTDMYIRVDR